MSFKDKSWADRISDTEMFYHSEKIFEKIWDGPYQHFGLGMDANDMAVYKMPAFLLHTPDYIAALGEDATPILVEVQGTGTNADVRTHKFKQKKLEALGKWNSIHEVTFWLWDDKTETYVWTSYASVRLMIARGLASQGQFDGHRQYWAIPVETVIECADTERLLERYGP